MENIVVRRMLDSIDVHYAEAVTLRTLSTIIGRQPAYLGRLFHQEVGVSFHQYLTQVRMKHAAALIRDGVKIEAVALCVGYRSKKNFYQQFRKHYATNPVPYRCRNLVSAHADCGATSADSTAHTRVSPAATPPSGTVPRSQSIRQFPSISTDAEPTLGRLSSILRATNRAWRLAVRAQEMLVQHFGRLQVGILLTDHSGRYITANRAALDATGYSATELHNLLPAELFVHGLKTDTRCVWQFLLSRPRRPDREPNATVRTKSGESVNVHLVTLHNVLTECHGTAMIDRLAAAMR